ncbi:MAG TPA: hypothetical protein VFS42_02985 [Burkholderiaceae bacterium]|nr:hypothetical protein [Burkholderiaceae bacterium]
MRLHLYWSVAAAVVAVSIGPLANAQGSGRDNYGYGTHITPRYQYSAPRSPSYERQSEAGWGNGSAPYADTPQRPRGPVTDPRLTGRPRPPGAGPIAPGTAPPGATQPSATSGIAPPAGTLPSP